MSQRTEGGYQESDWKPMEDELLDRVKQVAQRIVERVKKVTEDTTPGRKLGPDDPTDEVPVL
jgi:hypothetical protein